MPYNLIIVGHYRRPYAHGRASVLGSPQHLLVLAWRWWTTAASRL